MKNKIPTHKIGAESEAISKIILDNVELAKNHFEIVKKRFLDINSWELFAGKNKAKFTLRNQKGELILDPPKLEIISVLEFLFYQIKMKTILIG